MARTQKQTLHSRYDLNNGGKLRQIALGAIELFGGQVASVSVESANPGGAFAALAAFVADECDRRLRAYSAQPRDANEHFETEVEVLSGGYAYRQMFELVQNAADAIGEGGEGRGRIEVVLDRKRLAAANTGAPIDQDGVVALLNARSSSKRAGQIGRFGIGFKSLLKLGGQVDLVSRSIGLRFDPVWCRSQIRDHLGLAADARAPGMRLAQVLDPATPEGPLRLHGAFDWATTVVTAAIEQPDVYDRLSEEMASFPAEFILFLDADVELVLETDAGLRRKITRRREGEIFIVDDGTTESRWRLFQTRVRVTDPSALSDAQHLQAREEVPLAWAVPLGAREIAGRFWAFFPTQSDTFAAGILNAPWKLNSDRTNVIAGPWNTILMAEAAALIAANIAALATPGDPGAPISALPRQLERKDELAASLVEPLWAALINRAIVADGAGDLQQAVTLGRHPLVEPEALRWWTGFAPAGTRDQLVHTACQSGRRRAARLEAFAREITERSGKAATPPLRSWGETEWLEAAATADPANSVAFLHFVDEIVNVRKLMPLQRIRQARIVPTVDGRLVTPAQAILAPVALTPAGYSAVASVVGEDARAHELLTATFGVKVLSDDVWGQLLEQSLGSAVSGDETALWLTFWANLAEAPRAATAQFFEEAHLGSLQFRNISGEFKPRDELVALAPDARKGIAPALLLDTDYHAAHRDRLPDELWTPFGPSDCEWVSEWPGLNWAHMKPYLDKVQQVGWPKMPGNPQYGKVGILDRDYIKMPSSWRLLPSLPADHAAALTLHLLGGMANGQRDRFRPTAQPAPWPAISYGHLTRRDHYPSLTAAHPLMFWLFRFGTFAVGSALVRLKCLDSDLVSAFAAGQLAGAPALLPLFEAQAAQVDVRIARDCDELDSALRGAFWQAVFAALEGASKGFAELRPVWEQASAHQELPARVPTRAGPLPLTEIFVATDNNPSAAYDDDGRIVILSDAAAERWAKAGARELDAHSEVEAGSQLGAPLLLRDIFPELSNVLSTRAAKRADAVWVEGLVEKAGHRVSEPAVAQDSTGLIMIDRQRFLALGWIEGRALLLRSLIAFGLVQGEVEALLNQLRGARSRDARAAVRAAEGLPARLLCAVGGTATPLMAILPEPVVDALETGLSDSAIAELALAVFGPTILVKLAAVLTAEGLDPPGRWGGPAAREFVTELGFPLEFGTSASVRRDAELLVGGPLALPELHDYQQDILGGLETLLESGLGRRRAVVSLPTGGGKTRVAAEAVVRLVLNRDGQRSALWIAQTDELCEQAVQCFRQLWSNVGVEGEDLRVVRLWGGQNSPVPPEAGEAIVVVASIQTLNARLDHNSLDWLSRPGIVVIDECHHAIAPSYSSLLRWLDVQTGGEAERENEPPVIGLSATPWRGRDDDESARLAARFDRRWLPADQEGLYDELRRRQVLSALTYSPITYDRPFELSDADIRHFEQYGELPESVMEELGADPDRNDEIVKRVLASDASSVLLFANSVKHAQFLAAKLHLLGCPAGAVSGETDRLARQHFIRRFRSGELRVLCNHSVLTTGFDAPRSDMILISRPVFSPVRYMQMVGRGLRGTANGGTETCEVATVEDNILNYPDRLAHQFCRRFFESGS